MTHHPHTFRAGLYYCVREDFNNQRLKPHAPPFLDKGMDHLIVAAIKYFETTPEKELPGLCLLEIEALAHAAHRRGSKDTVPTRQDTKTPGKPEVPGPKPSRLGALAVKSKSIWDEL